jgi:hypothetical protein
LFVFGVTLKNPGGAVKLPVDVIETKLVFAQILGVIIQTGIVF